MKKCPYCGRDNDDDTDVCLYCYAGFPQGEKQVKETKQKHEEVRASKKK